MMRISQMILFTLFTGSFCLRLLESWQSALPAELALPLVFIPAATYLALAGFRNKLPVWLIPIRIIIVALIPIAATFLVSALIADPPAWQLAHQVNTFLITHIQFEHPTSYQIHTAMSHLPLRPWDWANDDILLPVFLPLITATFISVLFHLYIRLTRSIWLLLGLVTLSQIFAFSYFLRGFNFLVPLNFSSALFLQFILRTGLARRKNSMRRTSAGFIGRLTWMIVLITVTLTFSLSYQPFLPIWLQNQTSLDKLMDKLMKPMLPFLPETVFGWETSNLGQPIETNNEPLFYVQSPKPIYWRSQAYEIYNFNSWSLSRPRYHTFLQLPIVFADHSASGSPGMIPPTLNTSSNVSGKIGNFQVKLIKPMASQVGLLLPTTSLVLNQISDPSLLFDYNPNLSNLTANRDLPAKTKYTLTGMIPVYKADDLRQVQMQTIIRPVQGRSRTSPPPQNPQSPSFRSEYENQQSSLQSSPRSYPYRTTDSSVANLAAQITADAPTPYDKIQALIKYLQDNESYTTSPPPLLANTDLVTDFLFNTHQGYCVHFSTALARMANAIGFRTLWIVGFREGQPLPETVNNPFPGESRDTVRVLTSADAHSWVEIYFPNYGWIPFDATPGFENPQHPAETEEILLSNTEETNDNSTTPSRSPVTSPKNDPANDNTEAGLSTATTSPASFAFILIVLTVLLGILGTIFRRMYVRRRWYRFNYQQKIAFLYADVLKSSARFGIERLPAETPGEFLKRLPDGPPEWKKAWSDLTKAVEMGLYSTDANESQVNELLNLNHQIRSLLIRLQKSKLLKKNKLWQGLPSLFRERVLSKITAVNPKSS